MRQRITFLQHPEDALDPKLIKVTQDAITTSEDFTSAREYQVSFPLEELPQEVYQTLKASSEVHIKWVSPTQFESVTPSVSRLSPGLHVFFTPGKNVADSFKHAISQLNKIFGTSIESEAAFTTLPVDQFSHSTSHQYYQILESPEDLIEYLKAKLCAPTQVGCNHVVGKFGGASSIDINYDTVSHSLTATAYWPPQTWSINISKGKIGGRVEVGVLSYEEAKDPEELTLAGFLTVVGEDTKPSPTLFSFPARHHASSSTFKVSFLQPTGLHPYMNIDIYDNKRPEVAESQTCSLHALLTLPRQIFPDRHQLTDSLFLRTNNLKALKYATSPIDLEQPAYTIDTWGSTLLLELDPPKGALGNIFGAQVPLHLRYLPPANETNGQTFIGLPSPVVFWACTADEGITFQNNPFDRTNLGYDGLFGPNTMFYHLSPESTIANGSLISNLPVPVLDGDDNVIILAAGAAILVALGYVAWWALGLNDKDVRDGRGERLQPKSLAKKKQ